MEGRARCGVWSLLCGEEYVLLSLNSSHFLHKSESAAATTPTFSINAAISAAQDQLGGLRNDQPAKLRYLANPHGHLALVHAFQIQNDDAGIFYEAFVDAHSGKLLSLNNFVCYTSASDSCGTYLY